MWFNWAIAIYVIFAGRYDETMTCKFTLHSFLVINHIHLHRLQVRRKKKRFDSGFPCRRGANLHRTRLKSEPFSPFTIENCITAVELAASSPQSPAFAQPETISLTEFMLLRVVALRIAVVERIHIMLLLNGVRCWLRPTAVYAHKIRANEKLGLGKNFWIIVENHKLNTKSTFRIGENFACQLNKKKMYGREGVRKTHHAWCSHIKYGPYLLR